MIEVSETPTASAELDQLGAQLAALEAPTQAAGSPGEPAPVAVDYKAECELLVTFAFDTLTPFYPATCAAWAPEKRQALIAAAVPLATKYGFTLGSMFDKWGPEIGLCMVVLPMVGPTLAGLRADRATEAAQGKPPAAPVGPVPASSAPIASTITPPPPADVNAPVTPKFNLGDNQVIGG